VRDQEKHKITKRQPFIKRGFFIKMTETDKKSGLKNQKQQRDQRKAIEYHQ